MIPNYHLLAALLAQIAAASENEQLETLVPAHAALLAQATEAQLTEHTAWLSGGHYIATTPAGQKVVTPRGQDLLRHLGTPEDLTATLAALTARGWPHHLHHILNYRRRQAEEAAHKARTLAQAQAALEAAQAALAKAQAATPATAPALDS